jgi:hypothetical protein
METRERREGGSGEREGEPKEEGRKGKKTCASNPLFHVESLFLLCAFFSDEQQTSEKANRRRRGKKAKNVCFESTFSRRIPFSAVRVLF